MEQSQRPSFFRIWFYAVRIPALALALLPVAMGGGFAVIDRAFDGFSFLLTLLTALFLQAGAFLINDYYDYLRGEESLFSFPGSGIIQRGWLSAKQLKNGGFICFFLSLFCGIYLVKLTSPILLTIGIPVLLLAYFYSAGPAPLAYYYGGEVAIFLLAGPLAVMGTYYVQLQWIRPGVVLGSIPIGLLAAALLHANNLRDREEDRSRQKKTLATLLGIRGGKMLYIGLIVGAYVFQLILIISHTLPSFSLLSWLTLPLAWRNIRWVAQYYSPLQLNLIYGMTALLHLLFGMLMVLGMYLHTLLF